MSDYHKKMVSCPFCSTVFDVKVWNSINVTLQPELRERVLTEDIFLNQYPLCKKMLYVGCNTLYHDMEKCFMIFFHHNAGNCVEKDVVAISQNISHLRKDYIFRNVNDIMKMKEKILIFEANLDDVVVEYVKFLLTNRLLKLPQWTFNFDDRVMFVNFDGSKMQFVRFDANNQLVDDVFVDADCYANAKQQIEHDDRFHAHAGAAVDASWIEKRMKGYCTLENVGLSVSGGEE